MIRIEYFIETAKCEAGGSRTARASEFSRDGQGESHPLLQKARRLRSSKELQVTRHGRCQHDHPTREPIGCGRGWERI